MAEDGHDRNELKKTNTATSVTRKTKVKAVGDQSSAGVGNLAEGDKIRLEGDFSGTVLAEVDVLTRREITLRFLDGCTDISLPGNSQTISAAEFARSYRWELL